MEGCGMEKIYTLDLKRTMAGGGELVREMRAAVGRVKRSAAGDTRLVGIALDGRGEKLRFCFRMEDNQLPQPPL